ncbi:PREDICTED: elongator complex protein 6 [Thamnophis sirtalis]|uniref:Elongator complex protein 6 n=1 Tax=Thamnophis sirtalis TaxID=35019 RepID=A0A6I9XZ05_9SAUR|nr:PREDICTED: elongator complex protein 6 [Thamnophis sirtalis]
MFVALNELLGASVDQPERSKLILLCATKTDASFLVHHFLSFYLKAGCKVCFLAFVQSFSHYNSVAQKLGVNLLTAKEEKQLVFFEGLKSANQVLFGGGQESGDPNPFQFVSGDGSDLKQLYHFVRTSLNPSDGGDQWKFPVLIVDDLGVLLSLGVQLADVLNFVHYCRATVNAELKGNLVFMVQSSEDSEDEENEVLVKALRHQANTVLWAEGLASGYCKEVHGQLTILEKDSWESGEAKDPQRVFQYQIQDKNVAFFARGMSAAVL